MGSIRAADVGMNMICDRCTFPVVADPRSCHRPSPARPLGPLPAHPDGEQAGLASADVVRLQSTSHRHTTHGGTGQQQGLELVFVKTALRTRYRHDYAHTTAIVSICALGLISRKSSIAVLLIRDVPYFTR